MIYTRLAVTPSDPAHFSRIAKALGVDEHHLNADEVIGGANGTIRTNSVT